MCPGHDQFWRELVYVVEFCRVHNSLTCHTVDQIEVGYVGLLSSEKLSERLNARVTHLIPRLNDRDKVGLILLHLLSELCHQS